VSARGESTPPTTRPSEAIDGTGARAATLAEFDLSGGAGSMTLESLHHLEHWLDGIERAAVRGEIGAVVLRLGGSGAGDSDLDLDEVLGLPDSRAAEVWSGEGQRVLERVERLPVPTVAAIRGRCLGGATQVALACSRRVADDSEATRIGFPEGRLGVLPGWGGSVRLPRLVGVANATELLLYRPTVDARRARQLGLVDRVFPTDIFEARLRSFAERHARRGTPSRRSRRGLAARAVEETAPGRRLILARAAGRARREGFVRGFVRIALHAIADGVGTRRALAFQRESERFASLLAAGVAQGIRNTAALRAEPVRTEDDGGGAASSVVVLGAGHAAAYLAHRFAGSGCEVRMQHAEGAAVRRTAASARALFDWEVSNGVRTPEDATAGSRRINASTGLGGFGRADLLIDARPDGQAMRAGSLRRLEDHVREDCVVVVASAFEPLDTIAAALTRPERAVGLHLFHPAARLGLVEIVRGQKSSADAVRRGRAMALRLGASVVEVADSPGLLTWRLACVYIVEALRLRAEGLGDVRIESAARRSGLTVSPLRLYGELGPEHARAAADRLAARFGERFALPPEPSIAPAPPLRTRVERTLRRLISARRSEARNAPATRAAVRDRLLLPLVNEATRMLDEGIVAGAQEIDRVLAAMLGTDPETGGILWDADRQGLSGIVGRLDDLARRHGERFSPTPLLRRLATDSARLYGPPPPRRSKPGRAARVLDTSAAAC
jgi:3-hydroxyacyl-CoA dehydrogenase/enoyl-CoA hydratase/carnithine racemase